MTVYGQPARPASDSLTSRDLPTCPVDYEIHVDWSRNYLVFLSPSDLLGRGITSFPTTLSAGYSKESSTSIANTVRVVRVYKAI